MKTSAATRWRVIFAGIAFTVLWPSAATATKLALQTAQPFVISVIRFFVAGFIMLAVSHGLFRHRLPRGTEWKQLAIYGLLNVALYLGIYIVAMQFVSPGLGSLAIATNPVFIAIISALLLRRKLKLTIVISLIVCLCGVLVAAWPLFKDAFVTWQGLSLLSLSMVIYSFGVTYFTEQSWNGLQVLTINAWQTLIGGSLLLPAALFTYQPASNSYDLLFWVSVLWLAIPVSIFAVLLWLYLLADNPVKASFWLFFCPIAGFIIAGVLVKEPLSVYTLAGMIMVTAGLYFAQRTRV